VKAMLAQSIDPKRLLDYAANDSWLFQQKIDGVRALIVCSDGDVRPYNRNGVALTKDVPFPVLKALSPFRGKNVVLDGELVEGVLWVFDLPQFGSTVSWRSSYEERLDALEVVVPALNTPTIRLLSTARTFDEKLVLAKDVLAAGLEGIIARDKTAPYVPGLRAPTLLKAKFVKHVDAVVMAVNLDGKQNMRLGVYDAAGTLVSIGECTGLSGDGPEICSKGLVGAVVEVRYLSVYHQRLYQPNMPRVRTDKAPEECTIDQLKTTDRRVLA
jgi:ATP-dependent DNA ligase